MATKKETKYKEELPLFDIKLNAFEIGILVGGLSKLDLKIAPRIWKVTEQFSEKVKN
jgi:hypothetical protein